MTIPFLALTLMIAFIPAPGMASTLQAMGAILASLVVAPATMTFAMPDARLERFGRLMPPALIAVLTVPAL